MPAPLAATVDEATAEAAALGTVEAPCDQVWFPERPGGDLDLDGYGDLALGLVQEDSSYVNDGVLVVPGPIAGTVTGGYRLCAGSCEAFADGEGVVGDLDGDAVPDLLLGEWYDFYVISGALLPL